MYQRRDYSPSVRKSNTYHPSSSYHSSTYQPSSNYQPITSNYHVSRAFDRPNDNYISSYLVRKGPKKIEEPSKDYNFEEYFRILPPTLYTRYYNSHKFLNQGKRFFPNLRLQLSRLNGPSRASSNSSSIVSTPSSVHQSRSSSPIHPPLSPHFNYDFNSELVDGIQLSRAKSPLLSRPLSPVQPVQLSRAKSPLLSRPLSPVQLSPLTHLPTPIHSNQTRSKSIPSHSIHMPIPSVKLQELNKSNRPTVENATCDNENKSEIHQELNEPKIEDKSSSQGTLTKQSVDSLISGQIADGLNDPNLIRILSQSIIELTENLNLLFGNEHHESTKSIESNDSALINKIDQLRQVSKRLKDCTDQQAILNNTTQQKEDSNQTKSINLVNLADQLDVIERVSQTSNLQSDQLEPKFAECKLISPADHLENVQIHQQPISRTNFDTPQIYDQDENDQFNEQTKDKKLKQINKKVTKNQAGEQREESEEDEFFECTNDEQKDLRKSMFKGSKLSLEQLIDKAIDEQLLGQWLKMSDSLEEDGPVVEQKHSIEELKHKFATKLAIIHYKLYQKYSKSKPIQSAKRWRHRKLNKCNKLQSKYTLLQGLMDDNQFIQFLMDKINYFMRKIRQCKTQRKEIKKGMSKLELNKCIDEKDHQKSPHFEFDKVLNNANHELKTCLDENNNEMTQKSELDTNEFINIDQEMATLDEIKNELIEDELIKKLNEEIIQDLNEEFNKNSNEIKDVNLISEQGETKRRGLSKYTILFIFTLIVFMILIVLFQLISFDEVSKKCTNCARALDSTQLVLRPTNQLKQIKHPACDHRIMLEAQQLLGPRN